MFVSSFVTDNAFAIVEKEKHFCNFCKKPGHNEKHCYKKNEKHKHNYKDNKLKGGAAFIAEVLSDITE